MQWSFRLLLLGLLLASAPVAAQEHNYTLTVPVYESVPASLTRMREVLTALKATFGTDAAVDQITATIGSEPAQHVQVIPDGSSANPNTAQVTRRLSVHCGGVGGGDATALCKEIQHRYENQ